MPLILKQLRPHLILTAGFMLLPALRLQSQNSKDSNAPQAQAVAEISAALRQGNTEQALTLTHRALAAHPQDCRLLSLEGLAYTAQNQPDLALQAFQHALKPCPGFLPALEGAAQIEIARKSPEAVALLNRIVAIQPTNPAAQGMLGTALAANGDCSAALPHFAASQPIFPASPGLEQTYASCLAKTGDLNAALQHYRTLATDNPSDANLFNTALLEWKSHQAREALDTLAPLLAQHQFEPAFALGSRIAEELGDTPRAVDLLRTAILLAPDQLDNYLDFANLAFAHSSFQVGIDVLNAGLQRNASAAPLYLARGVLEMQISKQAEAVTDFREAHRLDPKLSLSEDALGIVQTQQHSNGTALATLREQARQHPDDPLMHYLLAEQLAEGPADSTTELPAAIAAAKRCTELDPAYLPARDLLAKLYLRAQQPRLALEQTEFALKQDPNDQEALYQELMARRRSGDAAGSQALVSRLNAVRKQNAEKQQAVDRYRLVEPTQAPEAGH